MYRIFYSLLVIFWIFDILNLPFMQIFDTTYPINTVEWILIWILIPSVDTTVNISMTGKTRYARIAQR